MGSELGSYNFLLIFISVIIILIASYSAADLYLRHGFFSNSMGGGWHIGGSIILGTGIWCMQYIGIFAYTPIIGLYLDLVYVVFTLMLAVILSYFSIFLLKGKHGAILSCLAFVFTICTTNFIGWEAYHGDVDIELHYPRFLIVVLVGCMGIFLSLRWAKLLQRTSNVGLIAKLAVGASFGLSLAICRYLLRFSLNITVVNQLITDVSINMSTLAIVLAFAIIVLLLFVLFGSYFWERITAQFIKAQTLEQYYQSLFEQNPDIVITLDLNGNFLSVNRVLERYGYTESELQHRPFMPLIVPDQLEKTIKNFEIAKSGEPVNYDSAFFDRNGNRFEINISNFPIVVKGQIVGVYGVIKDITEFKRTLTNLVEAEAKFRSLTENSIVGTYITQDGKFVYANQKLIQLLGYSKDELIGSNVMDYVHPEDHQLIYENVKGRINDPSSTAHYQYRMMKKDQTVLYVENFGSAMTYQGKSAAIGTIVDITARKQAEETIKYMAFHDSLTGFFNRNTFCNRLKTSLTKESTRSLALFYIDVDEFKLIDDALGHDIGDRLVKAVSDRLKICVPSHGKMGRNRGDEFLVSLPNADEQMASLVAERMIASLAESFSVDQYELYVTPSIGISIYPNDTEDQEELVKKAESAMNQAKKAGKNSYRFYKVCDSEQSYERLELEIGLRKALEREEFLLHYQPKFDLMTGKMTSVEALIRWKHPNKGFIPPGDFIPIVEDMGLIIPIGDWVLKKACIQVKTWLDAGAAPFDVSVNLSVRQLYQPNLVETVGRILKETGLDPKYLILEITESMMVDSEHALDVFHNLKSLGLRISLDDFGTGYSSLHYLKEAPIDKIKIDQSFVRNCTVDPNDATLVKTIIAMAHQLNIKVVAEGVETTEHLHFLQQNHCDEAQGFLFSKPIPPERLIERLEEMENLFN